MTRTEKKDLTKMIDSLVGFYNLDLRQRGIAHRVWFDHGLHTEIIIDYLKFFGVPANVRLIKTETRTATNPGTAGLIELPEPCPHFTTPAFRQHRFVIKIRPDVYRSYEKFVCVLTHELSHLILYSTLNEYRDSEVATDVLLILYGLQDEFLKGISVHNRTAGYITVEQTLFVGKRLEALRKKRRIREAKGFKATLTAWLS